MLPYPPSYCWLCVCVCVYMIEQNANFRLHLSISSSSIENAATLQVQTPSSLYQSNMSQKNFEILLCRSILCIAQTNASRSVCIGNNLLEPSQNRPRNCYFPGSINLTSLNPFSWFRTNP